MSMYFPCLKTNYIKENDKRPLEALIQRYCLHGIPSMSHIFKYENDMLLLLVIEFIMLFCNSKILFNQ